MQACPYDALYIDPQTHTAAKCNYCAHRIDRGLEPACVIVCPTQAIVSGDLDDPNSNISSLRSRENVTVRKGEKGTLPALFYIEGDQDALEPSATQSIMSTMWSQQDRGVGHYASLLQRQTGEDGDAGPAMHPLQQLRQLLDLGEPSDGVLIPDSSDPLQRAKAAEVHQEISRRAYDAPNKGTLWGWQVTAYVWTKAIASGVALMTSTAVITGAAVVTAATVWITLLIAFLMLGLTGYLLTIDLDQPRRFLYVLLRPQWKSWLVRGAYLLMFFSLALLAWAWLAVTGTGTERGVVIVMVSVAAALTAVYTALLLAQAKGRDFWQSTLLPVHMLVHALLAGAAVFSLILPAAVEASWVDFVTFVLGGSLITKLLIDGFELTVPHATSDARSVAKMITRGRYRGLFWMGVVLLGVLVPLLMIVIPGVWLMPIAGLLALIGLYVSEHIWIRAPQQLPLS